MGASWDSGEQPAWLPSLLASDSSFRSSFAASQAAPYHFVLVAALQLLASLLAFALLLGPQLSSLLLAPSFLLIPFDWLLSFCFQPIPLCPPASVYVSVSARCTVAASELPFPCHTFS